jgi:L-serine dehydratase
MGKGDFITIFNDVLGPVMRGPSSSHTAGAYRIARIALSLLGRPAEWVRCSFDPDGSYAPTYLPLGVDKAFCAGLIGMDMLDPDYDDAIRIASKSITVEFAIKPLVHADHPNTAKIEFFSRQGSLILTLWAKSTGGGVVEIYRLNDWPVSISGKYPEAVIMLPSSESDCDKFHTHIGQSSSIELVNEFHSSQGDAAQLRVSAHSRDDLNQLLSQYSPETSWVAEPVFFPRHGDSLFESAAGLLEYTKTANCSLGEAGMAYEKEFLGFSDAQITEEMTARYEIMVNSITAGLNPDAVKLAWLKPHAAELKGKLNSLPFGGIHSKAAIAALAVMHTCNSRGIVCAAPTGGSAGVIPAVISVLAEYLKLNEEMINHALFAAGVVGLIMAKRATFAAETAGCQVEIGIAGAMAAAAAVEAVNGSAREALDAAAIALQNTMGSVCDPVGGGCEIPCHTRNAAAAAAAFTNADLIIGGYPNPIPLDDSIDASYAVGKQLPVELRCTARGGLAITPSACALIAGEKK